MFKTGDLVECIDSTGAELHLTLGRQYIVKSHDPNRPLLEVYDDLLGLPTTFKESRFKLVTSAASPYPSHHANVTPPNVPVYHTSTGTTTSVPISYPNNVGLANISSNASAIRTPFKKGDMMEYIPQNSGYFHLLTIGKSYEAFDDEFTVNGMQYVITVSDQGYTGIFETSSFKAKISEVSQLNPNKPEASSKQPHKCNCDFRDMMMYGCQCGGI